MWKNSKKGFGRMTELFSRLEEKMTAKKLLLSNPVVCRECINKKYRIHLTPQDCYYEPFRRECTCCRGMHQMIRKLTLAGKIKVLFAHRP